MLAMSQQQSLYLLLLWPSFIISLLISVCFHTRQLWALQPSIGAQRNSTNCEEEFQEFPTNK